ncbi:MCE family protein [Mycobacterium colombiense]|uniref:Virulence factor Mce family protein n=1 Tax=Mycobacterium colombiense CECT 3035 TaxID=1041522 RepID=J4JVS2_9MYCO|nr:MCE family protein [Mycobacterium colombiense]EJO89532.1 virulence factor Mce family protein [Mycobacterium colombiense CECT 3035]
MKRKPGEYRIHQAWWTAALVVGVVATIVLCMALFNRSFNSYVPVTLTSDRAGLMMEAGSKVKLRGVDVGQVAAISGGKQPVSLRLQIDSDQVKYIPANVEARIKATSAFGNKFVELVYPENPSPRRLSAGDVLHSRNVATEVNTVFGNLVGLLHQIDPSKLNAVLTTLAEGLRGQGQRIGEAITAGNEVLTAVNSRSDIIRQDWRAVGALSDTYGAAAQNILATLDAASTTSATVAGHEKSLESLLLNVIGLAQSGIDTIGPNEDNLIRAVNILEPTTNLLMKYSPEYTCLLVGTKHFLDTIGYNATGGANGYSLITDSALMFGEDPYAYPDNLPIVAARGGPGGKPSCGSLPDVAKNYPVRYLVTNTGWGTGMDIRPNVGLGHPCYIQYFQVTRATPQPPSVRCQGPPSPGLAVPAPGPLPLPLPQPPPPGPAP